LFSWFVEQEFSPWSSQTHRSPNTHKRYAVSAKSLVSFCGNLPVMDLTPGMVERYKLWRIGQCGPTGVNRDLAALRFILNFAIRLGYIKDNPVTGVKMLAEPQDRMHVLSHADERTYLHTASRTLRDVSVLILGSGMRPAEVLSLRSEDIHLKERYALVPKGKTRAARRTLPLTENALRVLNRRMRGVWCFPSRRSETGHVVNVRKLHQQACRNAKLKFRLYDLRHTYGSRAVMAGVDLPTLKELMGHESISTTMQYVHPTPEHKLRAVLRLESYNAKERKLGSRPRRLAYPFT
jgi:integrase